MRDETAETFPAHLPWAYREKCSECAESKKGACQRHWFVMPRHVIPYPLDPEVVLPCVDLWETQPNGHKVTPYDGEVVTPEIETRCADCPVRDWCLQTALANDYEGTWAGTNYEQRIGMKTRRKEAA